MWINGQVADELGELRPALEAEVRTPHLDRTEHGDLDVVRRGIGGLGVRRLPGEFALVRWCQGAEKHALDPVFPTAMTTGACGWGSGRTTSVFVARALSMIRSRPSASSAASGETSRTVVARSASSSGASFVDASAKVSQAQSPGRLPVVSNPTLSTRPTSAGGRAESSSASREETRSHLVTRTGEADGLRRHQVDEPFAARNGTVHFEQDRRSPRRRRYDVQRIASDVPLPACLAVTVWRRKRDRPGETHGDLVREGLEQDRELRAAAEEGRPLDVPAPARARSRISHGGCRLGDAEGAPCVAVPHARGLLSAAPALGRPLRCRFSPATPSGPRACPPVLPAVLPASGTSDKHEDVWNPRKDTRVAQDPRCYSDPSVKRPSREGNVGSGPRS